SIFLRRGIECDSHLPHPSRDKPARRASPKEDDMAKGQQRSNKEKKKPKQDKKKLAPAPSPLASDQRPKPGWGGKKK
ncbi:MAG TPA: hypothetical protein VIS50_03765, partial [Methyloceanibacter sp.]